MIVPLPSSLDPVNAPVPARRQAGRDVHFGGVGVLVHELPAESPLEAPADASDHFWVAFRSGEKQPPAQPAPSKGAGSGRHLVFVSPGVCPTAAWKASNERLVVHFEFQPAVLEAAAVSLRVDPRTLYQEDVQDLMFDEPLDTLCRLLAWEAERGCPHGLGFFEALSWALAVALVRRAAPARLAQPHDSRIERAIQLLEQRFCERVSVADAAQAAGLSRCHFLRAFRASVGVSPHEYLVQCRLRYARRLIALDGGRRSLAGIAIEAGFSDQAHLTRHFRRAFGQTPGQWQRAQ